jgi:maleate isomerase
MQEETPVYGRAGRLGLIVPANNSVIEPELWSVMPPNVAAYSTRIPARGDLTADAVRQMEPHVDRAVDELTSTGVDVVAYCDMVTTLIMEPGWSQGRIDSLEHETKVPCLTAWSALQNALAALNVRRIVLGTPYPADIHAMTLPFFRSQGYEIVDHATLGIMKMRSVPCVTGHRLISFVSGLLRRAADSIVLLATDLPSFQTITALEQQTGLPVLTSNQTILWRALRMTKNGANIASLGRLFHV